MFMLSRKTDQKAFMKQLQKKFNAYRLGLGMPATNARERCIQILQKHNENMPYRNARWITSFLSL